MNIKRKLRHRIIFGLLPIFIFLGIYFYFNESILSMFPDKPYLILVILLLALFILLVDIGNHWKRLKSRNRKLLSPELKEVPDEIEFPTRFNFLDKTVTVDDNILDLKSNNSLVLHLNKKKEFMEIHKEFKNKRVGFNDVEYIFLEYDQYQSYMPRFWIGITPGQDKTIYKNSVCAKLKNGKEIRLLEANLKDSDMEVNEEYFLKGEYKERTYLYHGEKLVRLISLYTNKKYLVIDNI